MNSMDGSSVGGGFLSGSSGRLSGMEIFPMHGHQQGQMGRPPVALQPRQLHPIDMMGGLENEQPLGFIEGKGLSLKSPSVDFGKGKGTSRGQSYSNNTTSEDEEPSFMEDADGDNPSGANCKKRSPWQRMKWTDEVVRLLIAVVASVGDDGMHEGGDGLKRKCGTLQKKGKWKMVSNIMISKGCCVSPQQCEDKFNDLNKRYKKLNDILGRGTSCQVVENPSLMDSMPHLTTKAKDEVKKILGSKHLFYREMCAYHNGQKIPGCHDIDLRAHLMPLDAHSHDNDCSAEDDDEASDDSDGDSYHNDGKNIESNPGNMEGYYARSSLNGDSSNICSLPGRQDTSRIESTAMLHNMAKSPSEQREWVQHQIWQLEAQRVRLQAEALDLEKQRFKWLRFRSKKDRELERLRVENERMKLENERMVLLLKQKGLELGVQKLETSPEPTSHFINRMQGRDEINLDRHQ